MPKVRATKQPSPAKSTASQVRSARSRIALLSTKPGQLDRSLKRMEMRSTATSKLSGRSLISTAHPVQYVRLPAYQADVIVPKTGATAVTSFEHYAQELGRIDAFGDQRKAVKALLTSPAPSKTAERSDRPRIGILVHEPAYLTKPRADIERLIEMVERVGAQPVLIPPLADVMLAGDPKGREAARDGILSQLHGVITPGGADVHPHTYREANSDSVWTNYVRDRFQIDLLRRGLDQNLFLFGICRGHQLLNVAGGAKLIQDLERSGVVSQTHAQTRLGLDRSQPFYALTEHGELDHRVTLNAHLKSIAGWEVIDTNTLHHQGVSEVPKGFEVAATTRDPVTGHDVIEGTTRWNMITLQFHPEFRGEDVASVRLMETFRRSWAFYAVRALEAKGKRVTEKALRTELAAAKVEWSAADLEWIKRSLLPQLASRGKDTQTPQ